MGRQLKVQRPPFRNISDLRDRCLNIWYNLSPVIYQGLVASMPRRVQAVLRAKVDANSNRLSPGRRAGKLSTGSPTHASD
ncbi:transposase domain containing protein [Nephila pilipes]|uniref:Transposase domain containing protein n=1 Tax=Nephila pilipes TaxID=299642 RepID=A0A8X6Q0Z5_NEPPI|nr:transposase domain containing protein [Nephila pilipes]